MSVLNVVARSALFALVLWAGSSVLAQTLRDPTQAPAQAAPGPDGAVVSSSPLGDDGVAVVVRGGKPFLVSGTRLYAVGQKIGGSRIERISETEVWLRNGTELQKIQRFAGIQRRVAAPASECAASAGKPNKSSKPSSSTSPKVAPCAGAQP
jgi:hypothetical protein